MRGGEGSTWDTGLVLRLQGGTPEMGLWVRSGEEPPHGDPDPTCPRLPWLPGGIGPEPTQSKGAMGGRGAESRSWAEQSHSWGLEVA